MRTVAFLNRKGGAGRTTLAASVAVAAADAGERVIAFDLDPQSSLLRWGQRRTAASTRNKVMIEPLENERLPRLRAILEGIAESGFTLALFDTAGADRTAAQYVIEATDLCLLPARPTQIDVDVAIETFRVAFLAKRKAAFVLNQCSPTYRITRATEAAKALACRGILAEPMLSSRTDFQDAIAAGLGVTEYAREGKAGQEILALWNWIRAQLEGIESKMPMENQPGQLPRGAGRRRLRPSSTDDLLARSRQVCSQMVPVRSHYFEQV
jgi:chromosome partitioning protein